jgi:glycosyltransferase involved in cell wall biosynthesis
VFFAHDATPHDQAKAGFGVKFAWDVDLLSGYDHLFLSNVAREPGLEHFSGLDTPEIGRRLKEGRFEALLLLGWYRKCFIQGLVAAKRLGIPVMVRGDSHLGTPRNLLKVAAKRMVYPHFLRQFDAALVVGKRNRNYWEHYGYPHTQMFDAPHCVDNGFFVTRATKKAGSTLRERIGVSQTTKLVLFAGKVISFKRPLDVIEAVGHVRKKFVDAEVLIAGAGDLELELQQRAQDLNVPLHMLGFCNQTEMPSAYAAADVLILPSDGRETWGLVVNEALASGKPALVSDAVGCAPDLAELLGSDAVFRLGNTKDLSRKLGKILLSPPSLQQVAAAASQFDLDVTANRIASVATMLAAHRAGLAA